MVVYVIPGEPIALARPRFSLSSKRVYNHQRGSMNNAAIFLQSQHNTSKLYEGPLHLDVTFFFPYPKHFSRKKREESEFKESKPDLSNLVKFVEDIATGILYHDDAIISSISAKKVYAIEPRTEFTIRSA
jgi:Holliday junction resolvase RusA-like endonuclease